MTVWQNCLDCWKKIPRTWAHYKAFLKLEKQLLGYYKYLFHDLDKIVMYIFIPFIGTKRIRRIHRNISKHHIENYKYSWECNYEEAVIDWECSRFTKPNEPMTAREYLESREQSMRETHKMFIQLTLKRFGL